MTLKSLFRGAVIVWLGAVLTACATPAVIQAVEEKQALEIPTGQATKPVQFRKIVVKLKRGEDIGSVQAGLLCAPRAELIYTGGRSSLGGEELTEVFREELEKANYKVVGNPDALFEDPNAWKAEFLIAGLVKKMQANICFPNAGFGDVINGKGEAFMEVRWQIYSRLDRKVVLEVTTEGYGKLDNPMPSPVLEVFLQSFAQATRNLLADRGFYRLASGTQPFAEAKIQASGIMLAMGPLSKKPITSHINDVRLRVVTVFAGGGHGSGFFLDKKGHILTNEHVVRTSKFVKIKLATGREVLGEVIATNSRRDVALIKSEATGLDGLPIRRTVPNVGSEVYAIGSPLDQSLNTTISRGIISAYRNEDGLEFIQSDVNVLPGNSGGPLLDDKGNVVGIAARGIVFRGAMSGLNFFIPVPDALAKLGISDENGPKTVWQQKTASKVSPAVIPPRKPSAQARAAQEKITADVPPPTRRETPAAKAPAAALPATAQKEEIVAVRPSVPITDAAPAAPPPAAIAKAVHPADIARTPPAFDPSTADGLKSLVAGRVVFAKHVDSAFQEGWTFAKGGKLDGTYYEDDVYAPKEDDDTGKWWITGSKLCMQWSRWREGRESCADVKLDGIRLQAYDGTSKLVWSGEFIR